jgi:RNA polymerase sigma-70 factor (ECF subfamily)
MWEEEWKQNLLASALEKIKTKVSSRQLQIFDLYVLRAWSARKVAKTLRVSLGQVYLAKHRVSALLSKEVNELEARASQLSGHYGLS